VSEERPARVRVRVHAFARAGEALTRMERREVLGKLVLVP